MTDSLAFKTVDPHLRGRFGRPYVYEEETASTQALLLDSDLPEGAVAVAEHQTAGRGRLGREWVEPAGSSILCSVLLHPPPGRNYAELSLIGGVAVADTLERALGLAVQIKWPNDVMVNRRKVAGVLAEARNGAVVLGIGINANQTREQLPDGAGSLRTAVGHIWERAPVLGSLLEDLELAYDEWRAGGLSAVYGRLAARDFLRGRRVTVNGVEGTGEMIERDGRLAIRTRAGEIVIVESGEVVYDV